MSDEKIENLKLEIKNLQNELFLKKRLLQELLTKEIKSTYCNNALSTEEVVRYSRQMIMPDVSVAGQISLKKSRVLIVGVGGLGCPASLYLASAGVGHITLVDYDEVEISNLHRQVLHSEDDVNVPKVESAFNKLRRINSNIKIVPIKEHANSETIKNILENDEYDVVVDGSDNVATRYLLNDICVMKDIPLVSGSALQLEGQLTVYHYKGGPCYRCLFPIPPPANTVTNCGDGGVLGPVPGLIGVLQALETIKIVTNSTGVLSSRFLTFDGSTCTFRNFKLRPRNPKCEVCGDDPTITSLIDYEQFCGSNAHDKVVNIDVLESRQQLDVRDLSKIGNDGVLLDVRPELEFEMCSVPNSVNFPYTSILKDLKPLRNFLEEKSLKGVKNVYILCRRGNDSQRTVLYLKDEFKDGSFEFCNVTGGLHAYSKYVDSNFPVY
ncbi:ubiquitin-like activating enzyme 4 [Leptinotarsa decemlineata]|uniref:ubiquitin-like activating enzyme 4 n=1 Tax=Leptinotarsa decemlineata TaxID=7539 RepID=UPI003D30423C